MIGQITYIEGHPPSEAQAKEAYESFTYYNWQVVLSPGITPKTVLTKPESTWPIKKLSRLQERNAPFYLTKLSCVLNHVYFWRKVIEIDEPLCFLEHDAICIGKCEQPDFEEYLLLNATYVFKRPSKLAMGRFIHYKFPEEKGVQNFPSNYPLLYYKNNDWKGSFMAPGTAAYAITPIGAKKLLTIAEKGLDQSDFLINSNNIKMQYLMPSPVQFNKINLNTSHKL